MSIDDLPNEVLSLIINQAHQLPVDKYNMMLTNKTFHAHSCDLKMDIDNLIFHDSIEANRWLHELCKKRSIKILKHRMKSAKKEVKLKTPVTICIQYRTTPRSFIVFLFGPKYRDITNSCRQGMMGYISRLPFSKYPTEKMLNYAEIVLPMVRSILQTYGGEDLKDNYEIA